MADILEPRHLKNNGERFAFIKDTLTINFENRLSEKSTKAITCFERLRAMQSSHRIQIYLNIYDHNQFKDSNQSKIYMKNLNIKQLDVSVFLTSISRLT